MKTFNRICIKQHTISAENGDSMTVERGKEYLTSDEKDGKIVVFSSFWVPFPVELFAAAEPFTL